MAAGLKTTGLLDVALVVNDGPSRTGAGVFTANRVKAAPVVWTQQVVADGRVDAVVLNSGGANACTGPAGFQDTHATAEWTADLLGVSAGDVAVCSTGLIGERLPIDALLHGVDEAVPLLAVAGADDAARAIMTTDTRPKQSVAVGDGFVVGGMAKGAGMLAPGLATMLAVLTTDADVPAEHARPGAARGHGAHLRPGRLRRLHVDQRHGAAARQRRQRGRTRTRPRSRPRSSRSAPTWPASSSTTPRARPRPSRSR